MSTSAYGQGYEGKPYIRFLSGEATIDDREYAREYGRGEYAAYCREMLQRFSPPTCKARDNDRTFNKEDVL